jgi:hypothetical protein
VRRTAPKRLWRNWKKLSSAMWLAFVGAGILATSCNADPHDATVLPFRLATLALTFYAITRKI